MKVLLIGATGNVGLRLVGALLTHGHNVTAFVRSANKLEALLPQAVCSQVAIIEGDAKNSASITKAIMESNADAVVSSAGNAAMAPWGRSDFPEIFRAVVDGILEAGSRRGHPMRVWLFSGLGALDYPGSKVLSMTYIPIYTEHRQNYELLKSIPEGKLDWSLLCPGIMTPDSSEFHVPTKALTSRLVASASQHPLFQESWLSYIPLLGRSLTLAMNFSRYTTTLEQNADFIAADLEVNDSPWVGKRVGVIDESYASP